MINMGYTIRCMELTKQVTTIYKKMLYVKDNAIRKVCIEQLEDLYKKRSQIAQEIDDKEVHEQLRQCEENLKKVKSLFKRLHDKDKS